jgi:hypothetical protein
MLQKLTISSNIFEQFCLKPNICSGKKGRGGGQEYYNIISKLPLPLTIRISYLPCVQSKHLLLFVDEFFTPNLGKHASFSVKINYLCFLRHFSKASTKSHAHTRLPFFQRQ